MEPTRELPAQVAGPDEERADALGPYPEPRQVDLPDFLLQMTEPLSTAALDELRTEMDEQSENIARGKSSFEHEPLYPRKLLIVDPAYP